MRVFQKIKKKVFNRKGDSIAEVLIALLISSLALVMLAAMITASANIITNSKTKMNDYYEEINVLNTFLSPNPPVTTVSSTNVRTTLTVTDPDGTSTSKYEDYNVSYCVDRMFQSKPVVSFKK